MLIRLTFLCSLFGVFVFAQKPNAHGCVSTQDLMLVLENPNISYSQNMKIKNQLIDHLNVVLKTILNIPISVIIEVKD